MSLLFMVGIKQMQLWWNGQKTAPSSPWSWQDMVIIILKKKKDWNIFSPNLKGNWIHDKWLISGLRVHRAASHRSKVVAGCWRQRGAVGDWLTPLSASPENSPPLCLDWTPVLLSSKPVTPPSARPWPPGAAPDPSLPPPGTTGPWTRRKAAQRLLLALTDS